MTIEFELEIPVPEVVATRKKKYPFEDMPVGASFVVPESVKDAVSLAANASRRYKPKKFVSGLDGSGILRVWRQA